MQSSGPNSNKASIICILVSSLLEYDTSISPCWADNLIISTSNSIICTSYDALLLMQFSIYGLQELESKHLNFKHRTFDFISQFGQSALTIAKDTGILPQIASILF